MTPQDLIAAFDEVAEAADGVTRLRELVLQLAVRGKLVPQDPNDEPASVLLERISEEKTRLVEDGKIRKPKPLPPISEDEIPFEVSEGWAWTRLGSISQVVRGVTYGKADASDEGDHDRIAVLRAHNIQSKIELTKLVYVPRDLPKPDQFLRVGDILFCIASGSLRLVGKSALVAEDLDATFGAFNAVVRPIETSISRFASLFSDSPAGREMLIGFGQGIGINNLKTSDLASLCIAVPPLAEQHRIVAKVDELMGLLDRLEAARNARETTRAALRDAALAALRDADTPEEVETAWARIAERMDDLLTDPADVDPLRHTVLELAVRGRLVPQDENDEPASVLLQRIEEEKSYLVREKQVRKARTHSPVAEGELLFELPSSWKWARMEDLCTHIVDCLHRTPPYVSDGYPAIRTADVIPGRLMWETARRVTKKVYSEQVRRLAPQEGDIVYSREGERLGIAACVPQEVVCCLSQRMAHLRPSTHMVPEFLMWFLNSPSGYGAAIGEVNQTTSPHVNMASIRRMVVCVPPQTEQRRIVAKLDELMVLLDRLEERATCKTSAHRAFAAAAVHHLDT